MGVEQSKVSNRTEDILHVLVFNDLDLRFFKDLRQPPSSGWPIELDGSDDGRPVNVGVIHNRVDGRYVFDLFRLSNGATLTIRKVTREGGVTEFEPRKGIELLSRGRSIGMSASWLDWQFRGSHPVSCRHDDHSKSVTPSAPQQEEP